MTNDMIALASNWEDRLRPPKCDKKEDPQVWATSFPHLLTLTQKEKKLNPKAMITYKRPTTIGQKLTNYKDLALNKTRKQTKGGSRPCELCALCGCYGKNNKSMVPNVMNSMLVKLATNFPKDGQRIAVIGTNKIAKLTVTRTRWPCRGTIQKTTAL